MKSDIKFSDIKDIAIVAAIAYLVYLLVKAKDETKEKYQETVQSASDWLSAMFGPDLYDPIQFSPYTKPDGSRGSRVTRVVNLSTNQEFRIDYSGITPIMVPL